MKKHKHKWIFSKKIERKNYGGVLANKERWYYWEDYLEFVCECGVVKEVKVKEK